MLSIPAPLNSFVRSKSVRRTMKAPPANTLRKSFFRYFFKKCSVPCMARQNRMLKMAHSTESKATRRNISHWSGIWLISKCSPGIPNRRETPSATMEAVRQGTKAEKRMMPTEITSRANTAAVMGVPNRAENTALMPERVAIRTSLSLRRNTLPAKFPRLPPI